MQLGAKLGRYELAGKNLSGHKSPSFRRGRSPVADTQTRGDCCPRLDGPTVMASCRRCRQKESPGCRRDSQVGGEKGHGKKGSAPGRFLPNQSFKGTGYRDMTMKRGTLSRFSALGLSLPDGRCCQ
jgi:hypothetical protein